MNMKKFIVALVASTLALALNAGAQQDDQQQQEKKHKKPHTEQGQGQNASEHPAQHPHAGGQAQQAPKSKPKNPSGQHQPKPKAEVSPQTTAAKKGRHMQQEGQPAKTRQGAPEAGPAKATGQTQAAAESGQAARKNPERKRTADAKKPDVATIKSKNANFHAQPKPDTVKSVTFVQNRTIVEAQNWHGPQYVAFRNYRPVMHDRAWYSGRYNRIVLIGGGYYYFNAGYWFPAWGYAPAQQYYAYDGPIYAGRETTPPDQVIANVQSSLQEMGYYTGEVDGLLGPLTQEALNGYQADNDLTVTGAIDEPTLVSLNLS
jgi:hypothetical protein